MTFQKLHASFVEFRSALRVELGSEAIDDVNIRSPERGDDEASFLRLVAWCYAVLNEAGRVSIRFLVKLPQPNDVLDSGQRDSRTCKVVGALRTALFHNLGFETRDLKTRQSTSSWFLETCGSYYPATESQWLKCHESLCSAVNDLLVSCLRRLELLVAPSDYQSLVMDDFRRCINRDWSAQRFDAIIADAAARLGEKIDAPSFRAPRLDKWRAFLRYVPEEQDLMSAIERVIDREVFEHFGPQLPISTKELMDELGLAPGPQVRRAFRAVRDLFESGVSDRSRLLEAAIVAAEGSETAIST